MKEKVWKICSELCGRKISCEEQLGQTGLLYSFKLMELICSLENEFQIVFLPNEIQELDNFSSVNRIVEIVEKKCM